MAIITEITDLNDPELDIYARMKEAQLLHLYEPNGGIFIAESPNVVERALSAGYEPISALIEKKHIETQAKHIIEKLGDITVYTAEYDVLSKLTGYELARGMLVAMKRIDKYNLEDICNNSKRIAVLEDVVNPTNVGAIFRSAAALNIDAVLLTNACSDPFYRRSIRVSMGTVFQIPWAFLDKEKGILEIKEKGFTLVAMALKENSYRLDSIEIKAIDKMAIILGTEGEGLKDNTLDICDYTVMIPMTNGVDSLNVAAASAVAFWELARN